MTEGRKDDQDKTRVELISSEFIFALGVILTFGAQKYEERNWELGMKWSRVFGALLRHLWLWWATDVPDKDTGKSHLWHAACCIMFLVTYEIRGIGENDKPNKHKNVKRAIHSESGTTKT